MERNNMKHLGRSLKDNNNNYNNNRSKNTKDSSTTTTWDQCYSCCESTHVGGGGGDLLMMSGLISWPPRSYTCSFCKREFRSAQALGGHMNVHRRDRARLRHYSPPSPRNGLNLNLSPNPSPSPNSSSPPHSTVGLITSTSLSQLVSPTLSSSLSQSEMTKWGMSNGNTTTTTTTPLQLLSKSPFPKAVFGDQCGILKKKKGEFNVRLDLEIGLLSASTNSQEDLDLELRLGCS